MKNPDETVVLMKNYGKVSLKLDKLIDERGITRNHLAQMIHTRFEVVNKWYHNNVDTVDLDILARICFVLQCQIGDILEYDKTSTEANR